MRVLLVTWIDKLSEKLAALNPELEYCAIVVDKVKPAKEILGRLNLLKTPCYSMDDLKICTENLKYDYVVCVGNAAEVIPLMVTVSKCSVPRNNILTFSNLYVDTNFFLERSLRYFKEHADEFEMFATGISTVEKGIDPSQFKRKLFNFGRGSQDLYYNFQVAKIVVSCGGGIVGLSTCLLDLHRTFFILIYQKR